MRRVLDIAAEPSIIAGGTSKVVDRIEAAGYRARQELSDRSLTPAAGFESLLGFSCRGR
jgi:hypothetical protein